jgi:hypothetical protein
MNRLLIVLIASAFSATVAAQAALQTPADKAKQKEVEAATKPTVGAAGATDAAAASKAKMEKGAPKPKLTKEEMQKEVDATTKAKAGK